MKMSARAIAAKVIRDVVYKKQSLPDALSAYDNHESISFIKSLCFNTLRYWFLLEIILKKHLKKPIRDKDKDIECVLMIGLYQIILSDTPPYAAINEAVNAAVMLRKQWARGLINKILRLSTTTTYDLDANEQSAHPAWILDKIKTDWPMMWESIVQANNQQAPLFLRVNKTKISVEKFLSLLDDALISYQCIPDLEHAVQIIEPLPIEKIPGFAEGFFSVQDVTGQRVLSYLALENTHRVLDACCAPGSKTTHMLEHFPSVELVCLDNKSNRLDRLKQNIKRLGLSSKHLQIKTAQAQAINTWWDQKPFDRILLDAPCSGSGVIRRHPDIKLLRRADDIEAMSLLQLELLNNVWKTLRHNGLCVYTTCSIFQAENDDVIHQFLQLNNDAHVEMINNDWGIPTLYGQQVLPCDRDGFYYCVIKKC